MRLFLLLSVASLAAAAGAFAADALPVSTRSPLPVARTSSLDTQFLRDLAVTRNFTLGRPLRPQLTPDGRAVLFLRSEARSPRLSLYRFDTESRKSELLLSPERLLGGSSEQLSAEEKARRERQRITATGITGYELSADGERLLVSLSGRLFLATGAAVRELPTSEGTLLDPRFAPDGQQVAYVRDHNLFNFDLRTNQERQLTSGGSEELSYGLAEFVAQEEMSRSQGYWWSPDSRYLVYEEADARNVELWSPSDPAKPGAEIYSQRYPRPGKANVAVRLGVIPAAGGTTVWLDWDRERYPYLATVRWSDNAPLTVVVQDRLQRELAVLAADPATGKTRPLHIERDPVWLNLDQETPRWFADGSGFLWTSEREGAPQLEWRDREGKLVRVLVPPAYNYLPEKSHLAVDERNGLVYFRAGRDPTTTQIYRVALKGGEPQALTADRGQNEAFWSKNFALSVRGSTTLAALPVWTVYDSEDRPLSELPAVALQPPFVPKVELVRAGEGEGFYCSLVRPRDFDPAKRYPVIVDVYGGPGAQKVLAQMSNYLRQQWFADQGFIVVSIDGRGTPRRGRNWERAIAGNFASLTLQDQVEALKALGKRFRELDLERVGITGWSFGGYMSALAVLRRPDVFKAAVAGAPVTDWLDYDTHYTERYLGLPEQNAAGYHESSLLTYAADLKRPLMLVHGTSDDNVFFLHTLKLSDALFRAGREHEVLPLSGLTHQIPDPEVRARLDERSVRFFQRHLR